MVILYNCENDDLSQNAALNTMSEQIAKVKKITFTELQSKQSLQKTLQNLSKKLDVNKSKISASKNGVNSNDGSFTILTDNIRETKTDSTLTYTFQLETPTLSTSSFENFVIERQIDSTYNFYIYHFESNSSGDDFPYNLTTSAVDESLVAISSFSNVLGKTTTCGGGGISYQDVYGMHCDCCGGDCSTHAPYWALIGLEPIWNWGDTCGGASDGGDYGEPNWSSGNNNGAPNSGTSLGSPSSPATIILPTMAQQLGLFIVLTEEQKFWANKQEQELITKFTTFLLTNCGQDYNSSICQEAESFVFEAIEAEMEGGMFDEPNTVILDKTIINNQKVKCVYDKLKGLSNTVFKDIINDHFESSKKSQVRFKITTPPNGEDAFTKGFTNNGTSFFEIQLDPVVVTNASTIEIALMLIHESIHAELMDRCVRLGIINAFDPSGNPNFTNTSISYNTYDSLFAILVYQYKNYYQNNPLPSGDSQWNHDLFTVLNYRTEMAQNLVDIHPWLNDNSNDFLTNVNNDSLNVYGNFTIQQLMDYITWFGLESTQEFINTIQNNPLEQTKKNYVENAVRANYSQNCN